MHPTKCNPVENINKYRWKHNQFTKKTLREAQRTQGIDSVSWVFSKFEMKTSCRDYLRYGVNTLGPLCLWQCFIFMLSLFHALVLYCALNSEEGKNLALTYYSISSYLPPVTVSSSYVSSSYHPNSLWSLPVQSYSFMSSPGLGTYKS